MQTKNGPLTDGGNQHRGRSGAAEDGFPPIDLTYAMTQRSFLFRTQPGYIPA